MISLIGCKKCVTISGFTDKESQNICEGMTTKDIQMTRLTTTDDYLPTVIHLRKDLEFPMTNIRSYNSEVLLNRVLTSILIPMI